MYKVQICVVEIMTYNLCEFDLLQKVVHCDVLLLGYALESFDWNSYQKLTKFLAAPKSLFSNTQVAVSLQ